MNTTTPPMTQRVIFNIVNFSKTKSLYREGMSPLVKSTSRPSWLRIPSKNVFYYRCPDHHKNYVMSFAFAFDREDDLYQVRTCMQSLIHDVYFVEKFSSHYIQIRVSPWCFPLLIHAVYAVYAGLPAAGCYLTVDLLNCALLTIHDNLHIVLLYSTCPVCVLHVCALKLTPHSSLLTATLIRTLDCKKSWTVWRVRGWTI